MFHQSTYFFSNNCFPKIFLFLISFLIDFYHLSHMLILTIFGPTDIASSPNTNSNPPSNSNSSPSCVTKPSSYLKDSHCSSISSVTHFTFFFFIKRLQLRQINQLQTNEPLFMPYLLMLNQQPIPRQLHFQNGRRLYQLSYRPQKAMMLGHYVLCHLINILLVVNGFIELNAKQMVP